MLINKPGIPPKGEKEKMIKMIKKLLDTHFSKSKLFRLTASCGGKEKEKNL